MRKLILALLTAAACGPVSAAPFANVTPAGSASQQVHLVGDLDGDGKPDDVYLVKLTGAIPASVQIVRPYANDPQKLVPGELALAIVLHPHGKPKNYLVCMVKDMLKSPAWQQGDYKKLMSLGHGPVKPKDAKGPSIAVFTESGANLWVRWNGKTFVVSSEGDEP